MRKLALLILALLAATSSADTTINVPCSVSGLRAAMDTANTEAGGHVLALAAGCTYKLTDAAKATELGFWFGPNGLPAVNSTITIEGNGAIIQRDPGAPAFRLFAVVGTSGQVGGGYPAAGSLTLRNLTLAGGLARGGNGADGGGGGAGLGGAILAQGAVSLTGVTISNCEAHGGNGGMGLGGGGGGLGGNGGAGAGGGGGGFMGNGGAGDGMAGGGGGGAHGNGAAAVDATPGAGGGTTGDAVGATPGGSLLGPPWGAGGAPDQAGHVGGGGGGGTSSSDTGGFGAGGGGSGSSEGGVGGTGGGGGGGATNAGAIGGFGAGGGSSAGAGIAGFGGVGGFGGGGGGGAVPAMGGFGGGAGSATTGGGGAGLGGAVFVQGGSLTTVNTTISGNRALGGDGGNAGSGLGGAIFLEGGTATFTSTTIDVNTGVALYVHGGTANASNTIIADTTGATTPDCTLNGGMVKSDGTNLIETPGNCPPFAGDLNGADPDLDPLADNGGPTVTQALRAHSPALRAGTCAQETDQRGVPRLRRPSCDIGAYELSRFIVSIDVFGMGTVSGSDGTVCDSSCQTVLLDAGTLLTFTATPAPGWTFTGWGGSCTGTGLCEVTVNANQEVSATFTMNPGEPDAPLPPDATPATPDAATADAPIPQPDAPLATPDAPANAPDGPAVVPDAPLATPDAPVVPDAPLAKPDAPAVVYDARPALDAPAADAAVADGGAAYDAATYDAKIAVYDATPVGGPDGPTPLPLDHGCSCGVGADGRGAPSSLLLLGLTMLVIRRTRRRS